VNYIITALNRDKVLCGSFGLYPSYVADTLNWRKFISTRCTIRS